MSGDHLFDLREALVEAYDDLSQAKEVAERAGIERGTLPSFALTMRDWWWQALQAFAHQEKLLALLDVAIVDPTVVALKPRFERLRDAIEQEQASPSRPVLSKAPQERTGLGPEDAAPGFVVADSALQSPPARRTLGGPRILVAVAAIALLSVAAFLIIKSMVGEGGSGRALGPVSSPTPMAAAPDAVAPPAVTASPTPTLAPMSTATDAPTATPTSSPAPTPTVTPNPTDVPLQILNYRDGDQIPYSASLLGAYGAEDEDKLIRVFVQPPPNADGSPGRFYPQSFNHCGGNDGAVMVDGRWEQHVLVGTQDPSEVGKPFNIYVTTATEEGDAAVAAEIQSWCPDRETYWPGFQELPVADGGNVVRISVVRSGEPDRAPVPSRAELPGQVTITELQPGQAVGNEQVVGGTYADLRDGDAIWVLVHTIFGKWFPQSNPCIGRQLASVNGRWHATSSFGGQTGEPFEVVAVVADPEANAIFEQKQQEWCTAAGKDPGFIWPGLTTIELPPGITEKDRIRVYQK